MEILSPAKINLFLYIAEKRADGYHDLVTLMCCIDLFDTVSLDFGVKDTTVSCSHPNVPEDETNLAYIAAEVFQKKEIIMQTAVQYLMMKVSFKCNFLKTLSKLFLINSAC